MPFSVLLAQQFLVKAQHFGVDSGLSHRDVQCVFEDNNGFIWIGTKYGLNRFDGYEFKWYSSEKQGFQSNEINHILQGPEGWLWLINTGNPHTYRPLSIDLFDPVTESVITFEQYFQGNLPFSLNEIYSFINAPDGRLFFVSDVGNLIIIQNDDSVVRHRLTIFPFIIEGFSSRNTLWGYSSSDNSFIREKVVELSLDGKVQKTYSTDFPDQGYFIGGEDQLGNLWYLIKHTNTREGATHFGELRMVTPEGESKVIQGAPDTRYPDIQQPIIAGKFNFWVTPEHETFWLYSGNKFEVYHPQTGWSLDLAPQNEWLNNTNKLFFDSANRTWIGTEFGLYLVELSKSPFHKIAYSEGSTTFSAFRGITRGPNGNYWAGIDTGPGWMCNFSQVGDTYQHTIFEKHELDWGKGYRYGLFTDRQGHIWTAAGSEKKIIEVDLVNNSTKSYPFSYQNVWAFTEDQNNRVWFGTGSGEIGVINDEQSIELLSDHSGKVVNRQFIYQFLSVDEKTFHVATETGLYILDIDEKEIVPYPDTSLAFLQNCIFHIHVDSGGSYWLGTRGLGLINWRPGTNNYTQYTKIDGLSNNTIYGVYEDEKSNLWLPSDYGIIQFNKATKEAKGYLEKDGTTHNEFNRISHYQDELGNLFFGSLNGITAFHPDDIIGENQTINTQVVITSFQQFDGGQNQLLNKTADLKKSNTIKFRPGDKFFLLEFALLNFSNIENIQYAYKIEGVDPEWTYQKENTIRFSRLPYGNHKLRIRGQLPNGLWSKQELMIDMIVPKPIHLQNWFLLLCVIIVAALGLLWYSWRVNNYKARQEELERLVAERTATIAEQAEELKSLEKLKSRFFTNVSHELRTPLTLMLGPINSIIKRQRTSGNETELLQLAHRNGLQLQKLINEILDLAKLEAGRLELEIEPVHFFPYLKEQLAQFYSAAASANIEFRLNFNAEEDLYIMIDKDKTEKIIQNYLSNAMKFSEEHSLVTLTVEEHPKELQLKVSDKGTGIASEDLPFIFDRFYQAKSEVSGFEGGTGIGLSLVKELAELMGGSVWAESEPGKGSDFYYQFPKLPLQSAESKSTKTADAALGDQAKITLMPDSSEANTSHAFAGTTVLIVEDNADLRKYLTFLLSEFNVVTAEHGKAALEILPQLDCQLIVSDLMMPVMNGFEFLEQVKADDRWRHLPIIMLTAKVNMRAKLNALRIGVDDYLNKPFREEELKARIVNLLANYNARMEVFQSTVKKEKITRPLMAKVDTEWLESVEVIYSKHMSDSILSVEFVADHLNLSGRQFRRKLKKLTGLSPAQYLQEMRLQLARDFLVDGHFSTVKETCFAVGFNDPRYFSDLFSRRFGLKPSEITI